MHLAIIGATGAVGREILRVLEKRRFPVDDLFCFASAHSLGQSLSFQGKEVPIEILHTDSFQNIDLAIFCAGKTVSLLYIPNALASKATIIDASSAFRLSPNIPLIIPEINGHLLQNKPRIIASPNCVTTIMLMALFPLHQKFQIKRIVLSTYQAASGAGLKAMEELQEETKAVLENKIFERKIWPFPYAFNLFPHDSPISEDGYCEEEIKIIMETKKIIADDSIQIAPTCIRVPVVRSHSISLNIEFKGKIEKQDAIHLLSNAPGIKILENWEENRFPMPIDANHEDAIFCGRIRKDLSQKNTLEMWVVGDQLLKGAALNVVQIAEEITYAKA
ncbi:MAG: aspartate-semialdehyde dehydrogenase [Chlamydiae bacterium]|nr:aspartate-semialdehyde dehydrogenase [Chlamydiota bacterium]